MEYNKFDLKKEEKKNMLEDIKYFFATELEQTIGDLKAHLILDYILEEFGVKFYNKGISDAESYIITQIEDISSLEKIKNMKGKNK